MTVMDLLHISTNIRFPKQQILCVCSRKGSWDKSDLAIYLLGEPVRQIEDMDCRMMVGEVKLLQVKHRGGTTNGSKRWAKAVQM